jgi:hypothetical protein
MVDDLLLVPYNSEVVNHESKSNRPRRITEDRRGAWNLNISMLSQMGE